MCLAPDAIKNTNLKIAHRIVATDDRTALGEAMAMDGTGTAPVQIASADFSTGAAKHPCSEHRPDTIDLAQSGAVLIEQSSQRLAVGGELIIETPA